MYRYVLIVGLAFLMSGCVHGRDFAKPTEETFALGSTTRAEIEAKFGAPYQQRTMTRAASDDTGAPANPFAPYLVAGNYANLTYLHSDRSATVLYGGRTSAKAISFVFWNDRLVDYDYVSNFTADSSDFDEAKISSIQKGQSQKAEVEALLGPPTGRRVFPLVRDSGNEAFIYNYVVVTGSQRHDKSLVVLFTPDGVVTDYVFNTQDAPMPRMGSTGTTFMPIFIPHK